MQLNRVLGDEDLGGVLAGGSPSHARLERGGKQDKVIRELVRYNWPRTLSITGSAFLTLLMLISAFSPA